MKKICLLFMVVLACAACSFSDMPRISNNSNAVKLSGNTYKLPFEYDITAEDWTLIGWDKKKGWENLEILLNDSEDCQIAFEISQADQTSIVFLPKESNKITLNPDLDLKIRAQINGPIESTAKIQGELTLS